RRTYRFRRRFLRLARGEDGGELPGTQRRLQAQHEAAPVVDHHLEIEVRAVVPALKEGKHREPAPAEIEGARRIFAARTPVAVDTNPHDTARVVCAHEKQFSALARWSVRNCPFGASQAPARDARARRGPPGGGAPRLRPRSSLAPRDRARSRGPWP